MGMFKKMQFLTTGFPISLKFDLSVQNNDPNLWGKQELKLYYVSGVVYKRLKALNSFNSTREVSKDLFKHFNILLKDGEHSSFSSNELFNFFIFI